MGRTIERLALAEGHQIVLKVDANNAQNWSADQLKTTDVAIEFSRPDAAYTNIMTCLKAGVPVVSGTTAWLDRYAEVADWCRANGGAFFYASNFSVGVNIFFELNKHLAQLMQAHSSYDIVLEEVHHTQKLDAPSGTAVTLAEGILEHIDRLDRYELQTVRQAQAIDKVIPIHAQRIGDTPGTHVVTYHSSIDSLEIKHTAHGREGFASGALMAAQWLQDKIGVFGMSDLLRLQ